LTSTLLSLGLAAALAGCSAAAGAPHVGKDQILAVGAENQYANVIAQVGGKYVTVRAIESNPNADPHAYQANPGIAQLVGAARIVVQNGLGYDSFMNKIEAAAPNSSRRVIEVQKLLGLPDSTPNPHLWYRPGTMNAVARAVADELAKLQPSHAVYFQENAGLFNIRLIAWQAELEAFAHQHPHARVAVTEPVGDYMLHAAGAQIMTPFGLEADVMNGVDPAPQDVTLQRDLLARHRVKVLLYNQQVTDSLTQSFLAQARRAHIPVVGLYETMPVPGYDYQSWMQAELHALERAVAHGISTERLT
jgi:zinc/manganese transport system substrate-binding protein